MTFSRHLLRATVGILAALCLVLFVLVTSYFERFAGRPYAEIDAFVPLERVQRLTRLVSALREPLPVRSEPSAGALAKNAPGLFDRLPWVDSKAELADPTITFLDMLADPTITFLEPSIIFLVIFLESLMTLLSILGSIVFGFSFSSSSTSSEDEDDDDDDDESSSSSSFFSS